MDIFYFLAVLLVTLIFIIIPISIIIIVYFLLNKRVNKKLAQIVGLILIVAFSYFTITQFYPRDSFYTDNLKENTQLTLPKSAKLIANSGNTSIYNFGDYNISYMYQLKEEDYNKLHSQLLGKGFKNSDVYLETSQNEKMLSLTEHLKNKMILAKDYGFKNFEILFLSDNKTIVFNSNKW